MRRRTRLKRIFLRWLVVVVGLIFILPALWNVVYNSIRYYSLTAKKKALELENKRLRAQILEASEEEYIERIARVKLGLKKPDEIEYRFISANTITDR